MQFLNGGLLAAAQQGGVVRLADLRSMKPCTIVNFYRYCAQNLCERLSRQDLEEAMQRPDERELREQLARLRAEHRDLDGQILAEAASPHGDQLLIKRLKKRKLAIKDRITAIEDQLLPDIIA
jgi:hypothetical protein